jgi:hypothetical protein
MLPERLRHLPYLVHTNRELGLMLRGIKPLSYFAIIVGDEPECLLRYWRFFHRHVEAGRFVKREHFEQVPDLPHLRIRRVFFALPGEVWRIDALSRLLQETGIWSADKERRFGELLGYENWQNDIWMESWRPLKVG